MTAGQDHPRRRAASGGLRTLVSGPAGVFGLVVVTLLLLSAGVSFLWTPYDPQLTDPFAKWLAPSPAHLLGTDEVGRDIFSLLLVGARVTVAVAIGSAVVSTVLGVALAALGSLTRRWVRETVAVLIDILIAFPTLLIAMMIASVFGGSLWVVIWAVGISFGVNIARVTRPEIRRVSHSEYVLAGKAAGLGLAPRRAIHVRQRFTVMAVIHGLRGRVRSHFRRLRKTRRKISCVASSASCRSVSMRTQRPKTSP
jgi:peptide/nickel transport system permease protein